MKFAAKILAVQILLASIVYAQSAPTGLSTSEITSSSAKLSWSSISGAKYDAQVDDNNDFSSITWSSSNQSSSTANVSPLSSNKTYFWRVRVHNSNNWSIVASFTTAPSAPADLDVVSVTSTGASLSWHISSGASSYIIEVHSNSNFTSLKWRDSLTSRSATPANLLSGTTYYWRVQAVNAGGSSGWSTSRFTTTGSPPPNPPAAPTLSSPSNGATNVAVTQTLSWNASTGASSYRLQVSTSIGFSPTVVDDSTLTGASRSVGPLSNNTTYYWRVSAKNSGGKSSYSSTYSFTTVIAAPLAPSLTTPADNANGVSTNPTISWGASSGATSYRLQISTSSDFSSTILDDSLLTGTSRLGGPIANNTKYYWRVSATNAGGMSAYSSTWSFTTIVAVPSVPTLSSPANNAGNQPVGLTLNWNAAQRATSYHLQLSTSSTFSSTVVDDSSFNGTSRSVGSLNNNTQYYWTVSATNAGGSSQYSQTWSFTTIVAVPSVPTLSSPANNAGNQPVGLTLSWNAAQGATSYHLQLSTSSNFTPLIVDDSSIIGTSRQVSSLSNSTTYYWRVSAIDAGGTSSYSTAFSFTTIVAVPLVPTLLSPLNSVTGVSTSPTLTWNAASGATSYHIQLSPSSSFTTLIVNDSTMSATSRSVGPLINGTPYYWRLSATNAGGTSQYSATWSFTTIIAAPATPTLSSPANTAGNQPISLTLSWNVTQGAASYRVQLSTSTNFTSFVLDSTITGTSLQAGRLSNNTQYFWRVMASNVGGWSPYSSVFSFTTIVSPPAALDLVSPQNNAANVSTSPTFTWNESNGAVSYAIQVSTASDFSTLVVIQSGLTGTAYTAAALSNNTQYYWRVRATNVGGSGPYSPAFTFTTVVAAPDAPTLTSPVDGATGVSSSPTIGWSASLGATSYRLQVSTSSGFSSTVLDDSSLTGTSRQGGPLANSTHYYWRVRAKNVGGASQYSPTYSFTTNIAIPGGVSGLLATATTTSASLTWGGVSGASWFIVEVYDASFVSRLSRDSVTSPTSTTGGLAPGTSYGWRVQAVNFGGAGVWTTSSFRTPVAVPVAPGNLSSIPNTSSASMGWGLVTGATSYVVEVYTNVTLMTRVFKDSLASPPSIVSSLSASTQYYWRVQAINSGGSSGWTISSFTTSSSLPNPPSVPTLASPTNSASDVSTSPTLSWSASSGATSYTVQLSMSSGFSSFVLNQSGVTSTFINVSGLANSTQHFWRVSATNSGGTTAFSPVFSFTTLFPVPSAPSLSSPADGAINLPRTVSFSWAEPPNALSYHLQVSASSSFSSIVLDTTRITALGLTTSLNLNTTYYWRVSALNSGGEGAFSATRSFTVVGITDVERINNGLVSDYSLSQNYPNPFNPTTTIQFSLPSSSNVRIIIYNALGNLVHLLVNGHYAPGRYTVTWDASSLPSGMYFYRIQTESFVDTKRLVLLK